MTSMDAFIKVRDAAESMGLKPQKTSQGFDCFCPIHEADQQGRHRSLGVSKGSDKALVTCRGGCQTEAVVKAMGLTMADLFNPEPEERPKSRATEVRRYDYLDEEGTLAFQSIRMSDKTFRLVHKDETGKDHWTLNGCRRLLYGTHELVAAPLEETIFVVEGEKDADTMRGLGLVAVTNPMGAGKWGYVDKACIAHFKDRRVCILPDNDESGLKHAEQVAESLLKIAAEVRVLNLPGLPHKGDVTDWVNAGGTREQLLALVGAAAPEDKEEGAYLNAGWRPFPTDQLPDALRLFVREVAASQSCDESYVVLPLLASIASAIGNTARISLKGKDWTEPAVIWTVIVGYSGTGKSPAMERATAYVRREQADLFAKHAAAMEDHKERLIAHKKASKNRNADEVEEPREPVCERVMAEDVTIEGLAVMLAENPRGILVHRDELTGWIGSFDKYSKSGKSSDAARWLEIFGARSFTIDRRTSGTIHVPHAFACVTGSIQPGVLARAMGVEYRESGLFARLLFARPPRKPKVWNENQISDAIDARMRTLFRNLYRLFQPVGGDSEDRFLAVQISPEAKAIWVNFYDHHAKDQSRMTGDLAAMAAKIECYVARLALVIHCAKYADGHSDTHEQVCDADTMDKAIQIGMWFCAEAERLYRELDESSDDANKRRLIEIVDANGGQATVRQIMRSDTRFKTAGDAQKALEDLEKAGIGVFNTMSAESGKGRPAMVFSLS